MTKQEAKRRNYLYLKYTLKTEDWLSKAFSVYLSNTNPKETLLQGRIQKVGKVYSIRVELSSGDKVSKQAIEGLPFFTNI